MKTTTLITTLIHTNWPTEAATLQDRLSYLREVEVEERIWASPRDYLSSFRTEPARMSPFERKERSKKEDEWIARVVRVADLRREILLSVQNSYENHAVEYAILNSNVNAKTVETNNRAVMAVVSSISDTLSEVASCETSLLTQLEVFDALRVGIEAPVPEPGKVEDEYFVARAAKTLRMEAMIPQLSRSAEAVRRAVLRLVPLLQTGRVQRSALAKLIGRGRAEILARGNKAGCLQLARGAANADKRVRNAVPPSKSRHSFARGVQAEALTFDDLKKAANVFGEELEALVGQIEEITVTLGGEIPSEAEFYGELCECGCGGPPNLSGIEIETA